MSKRSIVKVVAGVAALALTAYVTLFVNNAWELNAYYNDVDAIHKTMKSIRDRPPDGVSAERWRNGPWMLVGCGIGNACFSPDHVCHSEVISLRNDIDRLVEENPPSLSLLRTIWRRTGKCSPHAAEYIERMTPLFEDSMPDHTESGVVVRPPV